MRQFGFSWHEVLWKISYVNLAMLGLSIPEPDKSKTGTSDPDKPQQKSITSLFAKKK